MEFPLEYLPEILWTFSLLAVGWLGGWVIESWFLRRLPHTELIRRTLSGLGRWMGLAAGLALALRYRLLPADWHSEGMLVWKVSSLLIATIFIARIVGRYVHEHTIGLAGELPTTSLIQNVVRGLVYIIGILIILQTLGISVTPALTALGVGGLAVALALQDTLGNLFAGIQIIASQKIQPGHFIRLQSGEEGYVADITWRNTTVNTLTNQLVIIPNAKLASSIVINANLPSREVGARVEVGVHYDSDLEEVEQVALGLAQEVLRAFPGAVTDTPPSIRFREFGDSSINMAVFFRVHEWADQFALRHELIKALHKRFRERGIVIPYPIRTLQLDGMELVKKNRTNKVVESNN